MNHISQIPTAPNELVLYGKTDIFPLHGLPAGMLCKDDCLAGNLKAFFFQNFRKAHSCLA